MQSHRFSNSSSNETIRRSDRGLLGRRRLRPDRRGEDQTEGFLAGVQDAHRRQRRVRREDEAEGVRARRRQVLRLLHVHDEEDQVHHRGRNRRRRAHQDEDPGRRRQSQGRDRHQRLLEGRGGQEQGLVSGQVPGRVQVQDHH